MQLMEYVMLWPKVITLSGAHCIFCKLGGLNLSRRGLDRDSTSRQSENRHLDMVRNLDLDLDWSRQLRPPSLSSETYLNSSLAAR